MARFVIDFECAVENSQSAIEEQLEIIALSVATNVDGIRSKIATRNFIINAFCRLDKYIICRMSATT